MSTVPAGYEAFSNIRRKSVTLLSIIIASSMVMGIFVYVDSYSVYEWEVQLGYVGPVAMTVRGPQTFVLEHKVEDVRAISGVTAAEMIEGVHTAIYPLNTTPSGDYYNEYWGLVQSPTTSYLGAFPNSFKYQLGRGPQTHSEIAVHIGIAEQLDIELGQFINYTYKESESYEYGRNFSVLEVVGIFTYFDETYTSTDYFYYYDVPMAVVTEENLHEIDRVARIDLDVDRSRLTPFDARSSLMYTQEIAETIKEFDSAYPERKSYSDYEVYNKIGQRIQTFMNWLLMQRIFQVGRTSGFFLLLILILFLTVRHNLKERNYEMDMLMSRGASEGDLNKIVFREVLVLSAVGTVLGLGLGVIFSRIASAATGFFEFNITLLWTEPLLVTIDSIIMAIVIGFLLPIASYVLYRGISKSRTMVSESTGKLAKLSRGLALIKWDLLLLGLSMLLVIMVYVSETNVQSNPFFGMILSITPMTTFLALASLAVKVVRRVTGFLSKSFSRVVGQVPGSVGVRRIGKSASSAAPAILVLVLAVSLAWSNSVIGASLPITKENHAKFAFGGDLSFHLSLYQQSQWNSFANNVSSHPQIKAAAHVSVTSLYLSAGSSDSVETVAINPMDFVKVGYDYTGVPLENSSLEPMLESLETSTSGAIITEDIAQSYRLTVGDTLRAFVTTGENVQQVFIFNILGIHPALTEATFTDTGYDVDNPWWWSPRQVGISNIWVNEKYLDSQFDLVNNSENILCTRTAKGANSTEIASEILNSTSTPPLNTNGYKSVSYEVDNYISLTSFQIDRSVDTMLVIAAATVILSSFVLYAFEGVRNRRREIALLRAMGAEKRDVLKIQAAEMSVMLILGFILLVIYAPLLIMNTLMTYSTSVYIFPISIYAVIPFIQLATIFSLFVVLGVVFIVLVSSLSGRVNLAESLNASWAETIIYRREE